MRNYIVWLRNTTDRRDDEPIKVRASSKEEAGDIAVNKDWPGRWTIGGIYTLTEFRKVDKWWADVLKDRDPLEKRK